MKRSSQHIIPQLTNLESPKYYEVFKNIRSDPSIDISKLIPLHDGDPDFKTPKHIVDATITALKKGFTHYPTRQGELCLRKEIANYHSKYGIDWGSENVIITPGSYQAFYLSIAATVKKDDEVLLLSPCYMGYFPLFNYLGAKVIQVPLDNEKLWHIDINNLKNKITKKSKIIVTCSPNNPTGSVFTEEEMKALSDIVIDNDMIIVSDEIYNEFVWNGRKHNSFAAIPEMLERTIVVQSFSKTFAMTGWRLGYLLSNENIINEIRKTPTEYRPPQFVQIGAVEAFKGPWDQVKYMQKEYYKRLKFLSKLLNNIDGISCSMPEGAFYLMPKIKELGENSIDFTIKLAKIGKVLSLPGIAFGRFGDNYIRLALVRPIEILEKVAEGFKETVKKIKGS